MHHRSGIFSFALLIASFGFVGCSGLVAGNNGNPPPPSTLVITNVQTPSDTTSTSQIVWTTNVAANSAVDYGTTASYGSSTSVDSTMVTNHQVTVSGLAAGTTYYYQVSSTDSTGNHGQSGGHKFKTAGFSLSGTIGPATGGNGATLALSGTAGTTSTTADSLGNYIFSGLPNGTYTLAPSHAGFTFIPISQSIAVSGANVTGVNFTDNAAAVPPSITVQLINQTVTAGQSASFSVAATGTAPLSFQWNRNGSAILGATSSIYTTPATTSSDNGAQFTVLVSNSAGSATSSVATLTVNAAPVAPSITAQPVSQTVTAGQSAPFSVAATGTAPLSFQWNRNGSAILGATSSSYTTPATTNSDNGAQFTVLVSNTAGSVTSNAATLTVNAAAVAPSITTQPVSQTVTAGQTASFSVAATGTAPLSYQWRKNSVAISGATSSSYTTPATISSDNGAQFTVVVSNSAGSVTSNAATLTVNAAIPPTFAVWVAPSLDRVGTTDTPGTASSISLSGARGETVDTQVIVQGPLSGLTNVNLSASALTGPGGASIPASSVTLYREYYIRVTGTGSYGGGSNPPLGSGTYPEPLIPFNDPETGSPLCATTATLKACNATISAGQNQPYWIDISVPRGATNSPTGTYTGTISITADQGTTTVPITLTVWNFGLPTQPSELSEWTLFNPAVGTTTTLAQALMRNKVMSRYDVGANAASDMANFGLNRSGLEGYYFIGIQCNGSFSSLPSTNQINAAAANFPAALPLDFYVADELNGCSGAYTTLKTMGTNAHAANPSVKTIMTTNAPDANLFNEGDGRSAIDHWVLLDAVQQWPSLPYTGAGDLWSYASCNTGFGNTPAWMVDYPPINERIQAGFLNWTQRATGILYWRADGWTAGNAIGSWNNVDTTGCGGGMGRPGDGIFIYPPGPIASTESAPGIRLKAIRDGIQDYEYAQILTNLGQVSFLNPIVLPIATSWTNWTHSTTALEGVRQQLGQQLNLLAPPGF